MNKIKSFNNSKKIVILLILIIGILSIYIGDFYVFFKKQNYLANINTHITDLNYKIENEELKNNTIKVSTNSERKLTLILTSLNDVTSKYELYYLINGEKSDNNDIEIGYTSDSIDKVKGTIKHNEKKEITISIKNNSKKPVDITFGCEGALLDKEIEVSKGKNIEYEINNDEVIFAYNLDGPNGLYPDKFPGKNDGYIVTGVTCNGANAIWDNENWNVTISSINGKTISCNVDLKHSGIWEFSFINNYKEFVALADGIYKIELWGARGGHDNGGKGAYTSGHIRLSKNDNLYVYVGGIGNASPKGLASYTPGGYNGGGSTNGQDCCNRIFGSGGGATDVRLDSSSSNNFDTLKSRIMVAAGGGGGFENPGLISAGGAGGGLIGIQGIDTDWCAGLGGTQILGGSISLVGKNCSPTAHAGYTDPGKVTGSYGLGGSHGEQGNNSTGGGAGYYGGSSSGHIAGAGGGSSFISGHNGCDAISEKSTNENIIHTGQPNHYSGYIFTDTVMIDGNGYNWTTEKGEYVGMPSYVDGSIISGNDGNGYARITYLSE